MIKVQKEVSKIVRYVFSVAMGIWFSILMFIWVSQLW